MDYKSTLNIKVSEIDDIITRYIPKPTGHQKTIIKAMEYAVSAGGKRIRPLLMQETFTLFEGRGDIIFPFMAAIEMIHSYSLVHDDLPAIDNDNFRRGKKSTHVVFGEDMGILAGDALLNYAFETAISGITPSLSEVGVRALKILSTKAGIYGMIGGQVVDVESENKEISLETLQFIHKNKTGCLIEASMMIGSILAGANESDVVKIEEIASNIGVAFQIQDDILDITSSTEVLGKPVGSDEKNSKVTYVTFFGIKKAKEEVIRLFNEAISSLNSFNNKNDFLIQLVTDLMSRKN